MDDNELEDARNYEDGEHLDNAALREAEAALPSANLATAERAIVRLMKKGGRGVIVPGGLILTAAHCIQWNGEGGMALGDWFIEEIVLSNGEELVADVRAAEPVADIAVLGCVDGQEMFNEAQRYEAAVGAIEPVPLVTSIKAWRRISAFVNTHDRGWIPGVATIVDRASPRFFLFAGDNRIKGGTSGSPIVDAAGRLLGVVSDSCEKPPTIAMVPFASMALPAWVAHTIGQNS